jgi:hypothetical protein
VAELDSEEMHKHCHEEELQQQLRQEAAAMRAAVDAQKN